MHCSLMLEVKNGMAISYKMMDSCLGFSVEKALYVPYTKFSAVFYEDGSPDFAAAQVVCVRSFLDGREIHCGMPDDVSIERFASGYKIRINSKGYTMLLVQNEPYPKINTNVTLKSLCTGNLKNNMISYEDPTPTVSNIYVKENSSVWDAAVAYCIKASGNYPYIKGTNMIAMTTDLFQTIDYTDCLITQQVSSLNTSMLLSDVYMQELEEDYPFEAHDTSAEAMRIVRSRYYPLDMQWLYDPQVGLQHKLDYSNRGVRSYGMTYRGCKFENLMDRAAGGGDISGMKINYIRINGSKTGVFTTVKAYDDKYGQR